jgi:hypothetical protein
MRFAVLEIADTSARPFSLGKANPLRYYFKVIIMIADCDLLGSATCICGDCFIVGYSKQYFLILAARALNLACGEIIAQLCIV